MKSMDGVWSPAVVINTKNTKSIPALQAFPSGFSVYRAVTTISE